MRLALRALASRPAPAGDAAAYMHALLPRARTPWRQASWCALDFELTGLDPHRDEIISFGAIPIDAGRVRLAGAVSRLVRPRGELDETSIRVHGLRAVDLKSAEPLENVIGSLMRVLAGRVVVAHSAPIERAFLRRALRTQSVRLRGPIVDTEVLGRLWLHDRDGLLLRGISLSGLAGALGLPAERPHDALSDALTTAQAFVAIADHLDSARPETVGTLAHADRRLDSARLFQHTVAQ